MKTETRVGHYFYSVKMWVECLNTDIIGSAYLRFPIYNVPNGKKNDCIDLVVKINFGILLI